MTFLKIAFAVSVSAVVFNALGLFMKKWWIDETGKEYGIFTVVHCKQYVCVLALDNGEDWMMFGQVSALVQFFLLLSSLLFQAGHILCKNKFVLILALASMCVSCVFSILHMFVLAYVYLKISHAHQHILPHPNNYVLYQTLPVGLNAISGVCCIPACMALVIWKTKDKK